MSELNAARPFLSSFMETQTVSALPGRYSDALQLRVDDTEADRPLIENIQDTTDFLRTGVTGGG